MKTTAEEFRKRPHDVYEAASQGEEVIIKHDRHRKIDFVLTSRPRWMEKEINGMVLRCRSNEKGILFGQEDE